MRTTILCALFVQGGLLCAQSMPQPDFGRWTPAVNGQGQDGSWSSEGTDYTLTTDNDGIRVLVARDNAYEQRAEVVKDDHVGATYMKDLSTGEMVQITFGHACWVPTGAYTCRTLASGVVLTGQMVGGLPFGHWIEKDAQGHLLREYDMKVGGALMGAYKEYHPNGRVMWSGQYGPVVDTVFVEVDTTGRYESAVVAHKDKVGQWEHRDAQGRLLEQVAYRKPEY